VWTTLTHYYDGTADGDNDGNAADPERRTVMTCHYDGTGRRIVKVISGSGDLDAPYHYYYHGQQLIETRDGSDDVLAQQVWGLHYIDELVQIAHAISGGKPNNFFYPLQDANYNVLGLLHEDGRLIERYEYTPYGQRTVYTHTYFAADLDGDNDVDNVDIGIQSGNFTGSVGAAGGKTRQQGDMDGDGDVDNMDIGIASAARSAIRSTPAPTTRWSPARPS
jgi:hypothetical protein